MASNNKASWWADTSVKKARKREGDSILLNSYNSHKYYLPMVKFKLKEFESWFKVKRSHNISGKMCCLLIADWVSLFRVKIVRWRQFKGLGDWKILHFDQELFWRGQLAPDRIVPEIIYSTVLCGLCNWSRYPCHQTFLVIDGNVNNCTVISKNELSNVWTRYNLIRFKLI